MRKPDRNIVERMRRAFPAGSRVRLLVMDDRRPRLSERLERLRAWMTLPV